MPTYGIVFDTNVLVSAVYNPDTVPNAVLEVVLYGPHRLYYSPEIMDEYRRVLWRPKFRHLDETRRAATLGAVENRGIRVEPETRISVITADPKDNRFLECAVAARADFLITGNRRHFTMDEFEGVRIVSARTFLESVRA